MGKQAPNGVKRNTRNYSLDNYHKADSVPLWNCIKMEHYKPNFTALEDTVGIHHSWVQPLQIFVV